MAVYFHGSFGLNRRYMAEVFKALVTDHSLSATDIATPFGYKAPFTNKYKAWLQKTSILEGVKLTQNGKIIFEKDPKLESLVTQSYMHHELTKSTSEAEAWYFFIKEFLPENSRFTKDQLEVSLGMKLMGHSVQHFSKGRPMNKTITRKLLDCYLKKDALGSLGLLKIDKEGKYLRLEPKNVLGPWESSLDFSKEY